MQETHVTVNYFPGLEHGDSVAAERTDSARGKKMILASVLDATK